DVEAFWRAAGSLLTGDPVRHTTALTVIAQLRRGLPFGDEPPIMITVHDDGGVVGVALCTPPWPMIVSALPVRVAGSVVDRLCHNEMRVNGVAGPTAEADAFASGWRSRTGETTTVRMRQRLYRLHRLMPPVDVPGQARLAGDADVPLLARWRREFADEALARQEDEDSEAAITRSMSAGNGYVLWEEDDRAVSFATASRPTQKMSRIGPVYTPKAKRGNGYGSAATAAASRWAIDSGAKHVVLFTDLANPTSNSIYQKIGYRYVLDAVEYGFASAGR
ncbi:MAG: GNAT family N-acetyltransferase, partial [Sciscionella sp.]|nr:GNAT family N-acetyltransferase [Sciscionella sp.]